MKHDCWAAWCVLNGPAAVGGRRLYERRQRESGGVWARYASSPLSRFADSSPGLALPYGRRALCQRASNCGLSETQHTAPCQSPAAWDSLPQAALAASSAECAERCLSWPQISTLADRSLYCRSATETRASLLKALTATHSDTESYRRTDTRTHHIWLEHI